MIYVDGQGRGMGVLYTYLEQVNAFRNLNRIYVSGPDIPDAVESFEQLFASYTLPSYVAKNVVAVGYSSPTPIQMQAIPLLLQVYNTEERGVGSEGRGEVVHCVDSVALYRVVKSWHVHRLDQEKLRLSFCQYLPT